MSEFEELSLEEGKSNEGAAIAEDHEFIRGFVPEAAIKSLTSEFISVTIMRTAYARVQLQIVYNAGYPEVMPGVDLSSSCGLPFAFLRSKEKECLEKAKSKQKIGQTQRGGLVSAIYEHIFQFIHHNRFVPCWKELKQLVTACESDVNTTIAVDDKTGAIKLQMKCGKYSQTFKLVIPEQYPHNGVQVSNISRTGTMYYNLRVMYYVACVSCDKKEGSSKGRKEGRR